MGHRWSQIVREEGKNSKGMVEYTKCQSAVLTYSSMTMVGVTGLTFSILQLKKFQPIPLKNKFLSSVLLGIFSGWYLARKRTRYCQELWLVLDDKIPIQPPKEKELELDVEKRN